MGIPRKYQPCSFDNFERVKGASNALDKCIKWAKRPDGFLTLVGGCGSGKTHLAIATLKKCRVPISCECGGQYFKDDKTCPACGVALEWPQKYDITKTCVSTIEMILRVRSYLSQQGAELESLRQYVRPKILLLDDVSAEKTSEWVQQTLFYLINKRDGLMHPTIITSNDSLANIGVCYGDRVASRLASGKVLQITADDYRLRKT